MSTPRRRRKHSPSNRRKLALWGLVALPVVLLGAYFVAKIWIEGYLRSDTFRSFVSQKTAETLHADGEFAPLHFTGMNVYSDGFTAHGGERAAFASLSVDQIRAELSLRRWSERVWQIEHVEVQHLDVQLDGNRIPLEESADSPSETPPPNPGSGWLPNRVEIGSAAVRDVNVSWGRIPTEIGMLRGLTLTAEQKNGGWDLSGHGGTVEQAGLPGLEFNSLRARYKAPSLLLENAELRQGSTGLVTAEGEVRFGERLDLRLKLAGIDLAPLLSPDWRLRIHGQISGDVRVQSSLPVKGPPLISGTLRLGQGQLEALPILDQIAAFTQLQQYRKLTVTRASGTFQQTATKLTATDVVLESEGLIRLEGNFTVVNGMIDGNFQVGVTSASLQWLPGSQERIFTLARNGYLWTPMRLTGPLNSPSEDLSSRLATAAQGAVLEKVGETIQEATEKGKGVIQGALDLLMPLIK